MLPSFAYTTLLIILVCKSIVTLGQLENEDWIDPYDMLNYDASTKTMRKPPEPINYDNVPTKRREHIQDPTQIDLTECNKKVDLLQREIAGHIRKLEIVAQQPTCNPVFKRFLTKLLKEIEKVGLPSDFSTDVYYDAKVRLSRHAVAEIRKLLEGEDSWRTGALDDAVSQILVDLKPHDYEAWRWHFEDTFGVEMDTVLKMCVCVLILVGIICCEMWSNVSWFVQFRRLFAVCFFISIIWNWFYLYKIAFAEHQNNMVKLDRVNDKCTGMKKIDWSDSLKEWFRSTWTLQDDPCKKYYEVLMVNPILLVPPTKAISVTITTFITEPMKHVGKGISEFLVALLKDLPLTLQIPVLLTIVLSILVGNPDIQGEKVFMYGSVQAAFQYGIMAPLRGGGRGPPPPAVEEPEPQPPRLRGADYLAGGDAPQYDPVPRLQANQSRPDNNQLRQRRPNRARELPVETLRNAGQTSIEDEIDSEQQGIPDIDPLPGGGAEVQVALAGAEAGGAAAPDPQAPPPVGELSKGNATPKPSTPVNGNSSKAKAKAKPNSEDSAASESNRASNPAEGLSEMAPAPAAQQGNGPVLESTTRERTSSMQHIETLGVPVQETEPTSLATAP